MMVEDKGVMSSLEVDPLPIASSKRPFLPSIGRAPYKQRTKRIRDYFACLHWGLGGGVVVMWT